LGQGGRQFHNSPPGAKLPSYATAIHAIYKVWQFNKNWLSYINEKACLMSFCCCDVLTTIQCALRFRFVMTCMLGLNVASLTSESTMLDSWDSDQSINQSIIV